MSIFRSRNIFCHLKRVNVLAIPVSNERKLDTNNSAAEGLKKLGIEYDKKIHSPYSAHTQ